MTVYHFTQASCTWPHSRSQLPGLSQSPPNSSDNRNVPALDPLVNAETLCFITSLLLLLGDSHSAS